MIPLTLALLIGSLPTSVLGQSQGPSPILLQESVKVQYPKILSTETIECDCFHFSCDNVYWFHSNPQKVQFVGHCNSANRDNYGIGVDKKRFKITKKSIMLPTVPVKTKPKPTVRSVCRCSKGKSSQDGCGSLILWPLVGIIASLALALIFILYYFSRLPKKCRHHFVKKR
ncbi:uncharacterized protein cd8b isoform X2 [Labrus mixtus]|uniref:uncharacterized protein cd8b isoform X2 n=1 Tax=Labrus mixtus TaxID=508554 RepID=UPI0029C0466A|nr:uncharacterized protein cd8b isoform X2 [Labrus mixtus]